MNNKGEAPTQARFLIPEAHRETPKQLQNRFNEIFRILTTQDRDTDRRIVTAFDHELNILASLSEGHYNPRHRNSAPRAICFPEQITTLNGLPILVVECTQPTIITPNLLNSLNQTTNLVQRNGITVLGVYDDLLQTLVTRGAEPNLINRIQTANTFGTNVVMPYFTPLELLNRITEDTTLVQGGKEAVLSVKEPIPGIYAPTRRALCTNRNFCMFVSIAPDRQVDVVGWNANKGNLHDVSKSLSDFGYTIRSSNTYTKGKR